MMMESIPLEHPTPYPPEVEPQADLDAVQLDLIPFDDDNQRTLCLDLLAGLSEEEREDAACISYAYERSARTEEEQTREVLKMCKRHLIAQKNQYVPALQSIRDTIVFRKDHQVNDIRCIDFRRIDPDSHWDQFVVNSPMRQGILDQAMPYPKTIVRGYDTEGRATLLVFQNSREDCPDSEMDPHLLTNIFVYWLERAIACSERNGHEKINVIIDYSGYPEVNTPPVSLFKKVITTLKTYYPERMNLTIVVDPPILFKSMWTVNNSFVNSKTREKIFFVSGEEAKRNIVSAHYEPDEVMPHLLPTGKLGLLTEERTQKCLSKIPFDHDYDGN